MEFIETRQILDYKVDIYGEYYSEGMYYKYRIIKDGIIGDLCKYLYLNLKDIYTDAKDYILFTEFKALSARK